MTIAELGSVGEFLGSIAVLATLIYLATQIRHSQKFAMAQAFQARCDMAIQVSHFQAPEIMAKLTSGNSKGKIDWARVDDLGPGEMAQLRRWLNTAHILSDNTCYQNELGLIPDEHFNAQNLSFLAMWYPGWQRVGIPISPRLQTRWDQLLRGHANVSGDQEA
jgi:hypothetical protein